MVHIRDSWEKENVFKKICQMSINDMNVTF